jgi:hypothetical protein
MASANANRTYALGSIDAPKISRLTGLPAPSSMGGSGVGGYQPKKLYGMDYSGKFRTGQSFRPERGISVNQILDQRENRSNAYNEDGTPVAPGTRISSPGWNTSGVGPGTRGYQGSGSIGSAAGAVGSAGVPTSQRGKLMKYGQDALDEFGQIRTTDDLSDELVDLNGLSQSWRYADMGAPPLRRYTNTNPMQTQSVRTMMPSSGATLGMGGASVGTGAASIADRATARMGDMIRKYLAR